MKFSRCFILAVTVTAIVTLFVPCGGLAQDGAPGGQTSPTISGTGNAGRIAVWKNSTTVGSSVISQSSGNIGIGTTAPATKLEVNGEAKVDSSFFVTGSITLGGNILSSQTLGALIQAPNDGSYNFGAGLYSLGPLTTGSSNTAIGDNVLTFNTNGASNTGVGAYALYANTTGIQNTAAGVQALDANSTGQGNTAVGYRALLGNNASQNTAVGAIALLADTQGEDNTATGYYALANNTTGNNNTAVGASALANNSTGSNNVAIGEFAGANVTTSNNIHIGNYGTASDSGAIRIGIAGIQTSASIAGIYGETTSTNNAVPVVIDSSGNLGTVSSSRRYKEDIQDMGDASSRLMRLRPVTFRYKRPYADGSKPIQYGLIAEEVAEVYPDLVAQSADGQIESVRYQLLDPMLLNELQKQHATIQAQKEQIGLLEERLARVEAALGTAPATTAGR